MEVGSPTSSVHSALRMLMVTAPSYLRTSSGPITQHTFLPVDLKFITTDLWEPLLSPLHLVLLASVSLKFRQLTRDSRAMLPAQVLARMSSVASEADHWLITYRVTTFVFLLFLLIFTKAYECSTVLPLDRWRNWISVSLYDLPKSHVCRWLSWDSKPSLPHSRAHIPASVLCHRFSRFH